MDGLVDGKTAVERRGEAGMLMLFKKILKVSGSFNCSNHSSNALPTSLARVKKCSIQNVNNNDHISENICPLLNTMIEISHSYLRHWSCCLFKIIFKCKYVHWHENEWEAEARRYNPLNFLLSPPLGILFRLSPSTSERAPEFWTSSLLNLLVPSFIKALWLRLWE